MNTWQISGVLGAVCFGKFTLLESRTTTASLAGLEEQQKSALAFLGMVDSPLTSLLRFTKMALLSCQAGEPVAMQIAATENTLKGDNTWQPSN